MSRLLPGGPRRRAGLVWLVVLALGGATAAHGEVAAKKPRRSQPARAAQAAPDRTGSIARAMQHAPDEAEQPGREAADDGAALTPVFLPATSRSRMLACGEHWHAMKMKGTTGDDCWRDFALKCLTAKDAPAP